MQCRNGKIISRLNNCALLNFRAFRIYLWLKYCGCCTWSHYTIHTQDTHYQEFIAVKFLARTGCNRNLAIIRPTQKFRHLRYILYRSVCQKFKGDVAIYNG